MIEQALAHVRGAIVLADLRQRRDQPERADREGPLDAVQAVLGLVDPVSKHEALLGQLRRRSP